MVLFKRHIHSLFISGNFLLIFIALIFNDAFLRTNCWLLFAGQIGLFLLLVLSLEERQKSYFLLSPGSVSSFYILVNMLIGTFSLGQGIIISENLNAYYPAYDNYNQLRNLSLSLSYYLFSLATVYYFSFNTSKITFPNKSTIKKITGKQNIDFYFSILIVLFFSFVDLRFDFLGGKGSFSIVPKTIGAIILFRILAIRQSKYRLLFYFAIIILFAYTNFDSKREVVFLFLPIIFFETFYNKLKFSLFKLRTVIAIIIGFTLIFWMLIFMTIARWQIPANKKNLEGFIELAQELIQSPSFLSSFFIITEGPTFAYHALRALTLVIESPIELMTLGSTYLKVLFVPFPRSIFSFKPNSMTHIFTGLENPEFLLIGGSYPVNYLGEGFWNFHWGGVFICLFVIFTFNFFYKKMHHLLANENEVSCITLTLLFAYTFSPGFFRGSSFDYFFAHVVIAFICAFTINLGSKIIYTVLHRISP